MYLTDIEASGVKLPHFKHQLKQITAVVGDNAEGKTALLTAARIVLTGKNPLSKKAPIMVVGTLDNNTRLIREWREGKSGVKASHKMPEGFPETPVVLLDPLDYLDRSETERAKYIWSLLKSEDASGEWVDKKIRGIVFETTTADIVRVHDKLCEEICQSDHQRHDDGDSVQDWLVAMITEYGEKFTAAKATVDRLKGFGTAQVQMQTKDTGSQVTRNVDKELAEVGPEVGKLRAQVHDYERKINSQLERLQRRKRIEDEIGVLKAGAVTDDRQRDVAAELAKLEERLKQANGKPGEHRALTELSTNITVGEATIRVNKQTVAKLIEDHQREAKATCACCGKVGVNCEATKKRMDALSLKATETEDASKEIGRKLVAYEKERQTIQAAIAAADKERTAITAAMAELHKVQAQVSQTDKLIERKTGELAGIENDATDYGPLIEQSKKDLSAAETRYTLLADMQKRHAAAQQEEARKQQSLDELTQAEARFEVIKRIREALGEARAELIEKSFGTVLAIVNQVASELIETEVAYRDGEIGRYASGMGGEWISHRDFSGFEKAVTYCGIAAALAQTAPVKVVLVDDLIISKRNKKRLIERLIRLIEAGVIHQVLMTDCDAGDYTDFLSHPMFSAVSVVEV